MCKMCGVWKMTTNYEKIKAMSIDEMAIKLSGIFKIVIEGIAIDNNLDVRHCPLFLDSLKYHAGFWKYYLNSEVEEIE